jgi:Transposase DDE domain
VLFICDLGSFKVKALASIATAGAYFFCRLNHQTNLDETVAGRLCPVKLAGFLPTVEQELPLLEKAIAMGAKEGVASRLMAVRMPEAIVNERRRLARKPATKTGYTPSHSHLALLAWNLFITNVPHTLWQTETVVNVYPLRWPIEIFQPHDGSRERLSLAAA